uniref:Uncharacterized protein n=1 Tax=Oryza sativa subsp. japonica TaxID=39947 RepID=Q5Z4F6_ORYSJ|nr:hypothetical protein [Oryza sativa Japonica Group]
MEGCCCLVCNDDGDMHPDGASEQHDGQSTTTVLVSVSLVGSRRTCRRRRVRRRGSLPMALCRMCACCCRSTILAESRST